ECAYRAPTFQPTSVFNFTFAFMIILLRFRAVNTRCQRREDRVWGFFFDRLQSNPHHLAEGHIASCYSYYPLTLRHRSNKGSGTFSSGNSSYFLLFPCRPCSRWSVGRPDDRDAW